MVLHYTERSVSVRSGRGNCREYFRNLCCCNMLRLRARLPNGPSSGQVEHESTLWYVVWYIVRAVSYDAAQAGGDRRR
jgi:hypothetical protein